MSVHKHATNSARYPIKFIRMKSLQNWQVASLVACFVMKLSNTSNIELYATMLQCCGLKLWRPGQGQIPSSMYVCFSFCVLVCVCSNHDLTYANLTQRLIVLHKQCFFCLVDSTKESDLLTWWMRTKELLRCYFFCPVVTNLGSSNIPIAAFVLMKLAIQKLPFRDANNTDCWITIFKMTTITKSYESCRVVFNQRWRLSRIGK